MQSHFQNPAVFWRNPPIVQGLLPAVLVWASYAPVLPRQYHPQRDVPRRRLPVLRWAVLLLRSATWLVRIIRFLRYPYHCQQEQLGSSASFASFREDRQRLLPHRPKGHFHLLRHRLCNRNRPFHIHLHSQYLLHKSRHVHIVRDCRTPQTPPFKNIFENFLDSP